MQVVEEPFGDVRAGLRRFSAQIIQQKLAAMAGRQAIEFLASLGMLFQYGCQFGPHGNIARCGVKLECYADHVASVSAPCFT